MDGRDNDERVGRGLDNEEMDGGGGREMGRIQGRRMSERLRWVGRWLNKIEMDGEGADVDRGLDNEEMDRKGREMGWIQGRPMGELLTSVERGTG